MIYRLTLITANADKILMTELEQRFKWINQQGYVLNIIEKNIKNQSLKSIEFNLAKFNEQTLFADSDIIHIFKHHLAEIIADHILIYWEPKLVWKEIRQLSKKNNPADKEIVYEKTLHFLHSGYDSASLNLLINFGRKSRIANRLQEYLNQFDDIMVEGFVKFRLNDYLAEIRCSVELAFEELRNEKEYHDFITLLRYFVDTQAPKVFEVNLMLDNNGLFYLWDRNGVKIEDNYINYYLDDMLMDEINFDDVLISILVSIAPRRLIVHNGTSSHNEKSLNVVKNVFRDRIQICSGCDRCCRVIEQHNQ